jgi:predicted TIM-barrel fold metal-dependent hydrolase
MNMRIIDSHIHYGAFEGIPCITADFQRVLEETRAAGASAHVLVSTLEQLAPVPTQARPLLEGNEEMLRNVERESDCWMLAVLHPEMPEVIAQAAQLLKHPKCLGVKCGPHYHRYEMGGPAGRTIFEFLVEHDTQAIIHTGNDKYDHPASIFALSDEFPEARVLLAHMATIGYGRGHAELAARHPSRNVWLGYDYPLCSRYGLLEACVELIGAERIIFASDMPCYYPKPTIAGVLSAHISDEDKQKIFADNAERFFRRKLT